MRQVEYNQLALTMFVDGDNMYYLGVPETLSPERISDELTMKGFEHPIIEGMKIMDRYAFIEEFKVALANKILYSDPILSEIMSCNIQ